MSEERRELCRWAITCRVDLVDMFGRAWVGLIKDLSPEGMFVAYAPELRLGSTVGVSFALPGRETIKLTAKVVRVVPEGVGLQFVGLSEAAAQNPRRNDLRAYCAALHEAWEEARMRGDDGQQGMLRVSLTRSVPENHPLRPIRAMANQTLQTMSGEFSNVLFTTGQLAIAPALLLRALLLQALYSIRSERLLMDQLEYNLLFRWFVGLRTNDSAWDTDLFAKNRDRLLRAVVARRFLDEVATLARLTGLLSDEHFSVDAALLAAWASKAVAAPRSNPPPGRTAKRAGRPPARGS